MRTITLDLPDAMPMIALAELAAAINCRMTLVEHNHFRFKKADGLHAQNVVQMPVRRAQHTPEPTPPGAA